MRLVHLGHAMWLAEVAGLRLLFDPLIGGQHHGGVFDVWPPRTIEVDRLRADFLFISHRHPDHFDVASLRALHAVDDETVIVTPDPLIERVANTIGFRSVRRIDARTRVELDDVRIVTTPSRADVVEWGVMIEGDGAVVYNQVDTALGAPDDVRAMVADVASALGREADGLITLGLVRWQPLLEVEALLGRRFGFPHRAYDELLDHVAALGARTVIPASAGAVHRAPFEFMNALVYPLPEARFLRDVVRLPGVVAFPAVTGGAYEIEGDAVSFDPKGGNDLIQILPHGEDPRRFRPTAIPDVFDPNLDERPEAVTRTTIDRWVAGSLCDALAGALSSSGARVLVLEVVHPSHHDHYTMRVDRTGVRLERAHRDDDWDALVVIAGSMLVDVIEGRRHWGDALLSGSLRAVTRVNPREIAAIFLYYAISYEQSIVRALEHELGCTLGS